MNTLVPVATRYSFRPPEMMRGAPMDTARLYNPHEITVEHRGGGTWAILHGPGWSPQAVWCERRGEWEYEPLPSSRDDAFLARCRYDLETALRIAGRLAAEQENERG